MKKILIGLLICIPLIIVFAINVSGDIIADNADITIESIELYHEGNPILDTIDIDINDYRDRAYRIEAVTYPAIAKKELKWYSSDMGIANVDKTTGDVTFTGKAFGEVKIFCESVNNNTIRAVAEFYVSGSEVYSLQIVINGESEYRSNLNMNLGDTLYLNKIVQPAPAIREKKTIWESSNPSVATIDATGIVRAISAGTTKIKATVYEPANDEYISSEVDLTVNVGNNILKKGRLVITTDTVNLQNYALTSDFTLIDVVGEATVDGTNLTYTGTEAGEVTLRVTKGNRTENLTVRFTKGAYELTYQNLDVLQNTVWGQGAFVNKGVYEYSLVAVIANDDYVGDPLVNVNYVISDASSLVRDNETGLLFGQNGNSSTVTITATAEGFAPAVIEVEIKTPLERVNITIDNDEDNRGVEGTRVWGNKFAVKIENLPAEYDISKVVRPTVDFAYGYVNTYQFSVASYSPSNADLTFDYYTTNEEYATVDENGVITFHEAAIGNQVGVYMVARYGFGAGAARDGYVFNVVDGINLGWNVAEDDDSVNLEKITADHSLINFELAMEFAYFMEGWYWQYDRPENCVDGKQLKKENIILQNDIYYHPDHWEPYALTSIYGNGFKIDGRFKVVDNESFILKMNRTLGGDIVFQNVILNSATPPSDGSDWAGLQEKGGYIAGIGNHFWEDMEYDYFGYCGCGNACTDWASCPNWIDRTWEKDYELDAEGNTKIRDTNVLFKYCQIQNTFNSIVVKRGNVTVDGCIFRNTVSAAIMYNPQYTNTELANITNDAPAQKFNNPCTLTVNNCIFANSLAPAIMFTPPFLTGNVQNPALMGLKITGQNYIYNWKKIKDINLAILEPSTLPGGMADAVNKDINAMFKKVLEREEFDDMKVKNRETGSARNEDYINLSICVLGLWFDAETVPIEYDNTLWRDSYTDVSDLGGIVALFATYDIRLLMNYSDNEEFNTMPDEKYDTAADEDGNPIWMKRLRGEV